MMKKISNRELEERVNRAVDNFMQGYGCCQSVLAAFCDLYGMDETLALKVAAGFGGGVGRLRMMCGAVSGCSSDWTAGRPRVATVKVSRRVIRWCRTCWHSRRLRTAV